MFKLKENHLAPKEKTKNIIFYVLFTSFLFNKLPLSLNFVFKLVPSRTGRDITILCFFLT